MSITEDPTIVEERAEDLPPTPEAQAALAGGGGLPPAPEEEVVVERPPSMRLAVAVGFPVAAAALMIGGVFRGVEPRIYAVVAGILGVALAAIVVRVKRPIVALAAMVVGLFVIGVLMVVPGNPSDAGSVAALARDSARHSDLLRPPVPFEPGWHAIVGWLLAIIGFAAAWLAMAVRKPSIALLLPLPFAAFAGISVPDNQQVASGLAVLVLFAIGLGLLSSEQSVGDDDERPPIGYEIRKAIKAMPLLAVIVVALYFVSKAGFLFPSPAIDPTKQPQKPKTVPISEVQDRELFQVTSPISGPWRMGALDFYEPSDGTWRLPPFNEDNLVDVKRSGVVNDRLKGGVQATFVIKGLGGAVLPGLPNPVGVVAKGIDSGLQYDTRTNNIRLRDGQVKSNLTFTAVAAKLPSVDDLRKTVRAVPRELKQFTELPAPPPAAQELIDTAKSKYPDDWDRFDYLRTYVLDNVVAKGVGTPVAVDMDRVQEILSKLQASPYEMVALQAMFGRWVGLPARIGYGFDGGDVVEGKSQTLSIRPRNGASFPEVYFDDFGWLPVIGKPKKAEATVNSDPNQQQVDPNVLPSDDVAAQVYLPIIVPPPSTAAKQLAVTLLALLVLALIIGLAYMTYPALRKARLRGKRREAALRDGPRARVALAYSEWRDYATDLGFSHPNDTPLMFLDRFVPDDEHTELAWLVTRGLWGDLQDELDDDHATAAVEISRSLRRRLGSTQPATLRAVAVVSRLSLKHPYAADEEPDSTEPAARRFLRRGTGRFGPGGRSRKEAADALA